MSKNTLRVKAIAIQDTKYSRETRLTSHRAHWFFGSKRRKIMSISKYKLHTGGLEPILLTRGLYLLSKIWWSLKARDSGLEFSNRSEICQAARQEPRCLSNFRAIRSLWPPISWHQDLTRFGSEMFYRLVNRDPDSPNQRSFSDINESLHIYHITYIWPYYNMPWVSKC